MSENATQKCQNCSEVVPLEYATCPFCGFGLLEYELEQFSYKPKIREIINRLISFYRNPIKTSKEIGIATEMRGGNFIIYFFSLFLSLRLFFTILKAGLNFTTSITIGSVGDPPEPFITLRLGFLLFLVNLLILPFFIFLIYKILFSFGSWFISKFSAMLGADIKTEQMKTILGYSIGPIAIGEFLGIFFTLIGPGGNLGSTASVDFNAILEFMENLYTSGVMIVFKFLMLIMWLATLVYATIGLRTIGKMAWINAVIAMGLPLGVYIWFFYITGMLG